MPMIKFTALSIKNIKSPTDKNYVDYSDSQTTGLKFRAYKTGRKVYLFRYKLHGKQKDYTIGDVDKLSLADARAECMALRARVKSGEDVKVQRDTKVQEIAGVPTVSEFADTYITRWAKPRKKSWKEDQRILNADVIPIIGTLKLDKVTKKHINALLDRKLDSGAKVASNRLLALLSKLFNFAIERGEIEINPTAKITKEKETRRTRVLTDDEIKLLWQATSEESNLDISTRLAIRMRLITGQRSIEIVSMKQTNIKDGVWHMPETKNSLPHAIPLTEMAMDIINTALPHSRNGLLFPARNGKVMNVRILSQIFDRIEWELEEEQKRPTPHDLRRTLRTGLGELKFDNFIQRKVTNHKSNSHEENQLDMTYNVHAYMDDKKRALEAWERKLKQTLFDDVDDNVVQLHPTG